MNKKIEQSKSRLLEAKSERERKKVRYDAHVLILDGHRKTMRLLEDQNQALINEFTEADRAVGELEKQLQQTIDEESKIEGDERTKV